jgi:DNA repair exonuclease SbcCD ATPase subunit
MKFARYLPFALLALSLYWNYAQNKQLNSELLKVSQLQSDNIKLEHELIQARDDKQLQISSERKVLQTLESDIAKINQQLAGLTGRLKGTNDVPLGGNNSSTLQWDIQHQKEVIADLERQLRDIKAQESQISDQNKAVQSQDKKSRSESELALQAQINYQEQNLRNIENTYNQARRDRAAAEVQDKLKVQVEEQRKFVAAVKLQKQTLGVRWDQVAAERGNVGQALAQLKGQETTLQDQIQTEKKNLDRLQKDLGANQKVAGAYKSQLSQIQKDLDSKRAQLTDLQEQKREHQQHLQSLLGQ